jgi:hypothetical protein
MHLQTVESQIPNGSEEDERIVQATLDSPAYQAEKNYVEQCEGYTVIERVRLFKHLEENLVRVVFPVECGPLELGSVIAVTCLYDLDKDYNIYGHTICAGPGANTLLRAIHAPLGNAHPQPGEEGQKAIMRFVDFKRALWDRLLLESLDLGEQQATEHFVRDFWKSLDRMFGANTLYNCPDDYHWKG